MIKATRCDKFTYKYCFYWRVVQIKPFQIIPVIDLMRGKVVHARFGQRDQYQPINSLLCQTSEALDVVSALLKLYPFQTLYIADIDAIQGIGNHDTLIEKMNQTFPSIAIWLDCGNHQSSCKVKPVLGSESIKDLQSYLENKKPHVLSLDFNAQDAIGNAELHQSSEYWPEEVICMALNAVGRKLGADYERLNHLIALNQSRKNPSAIYAAGGVRNTEDLQTLENMGISGALLATALHNGHITGEDIVKFYRQ